MYPVKVFELAICCVDLGGILVPLVVFLCEMKMMLYYSSITSQVLQVTTRTMPFKLLTGEYVPTEFSRRNHYGFVKDITLYLLHMNTCWIQ